MAARAVARGGSESVPVRGHRAVVLAVAPATCGNGVALCLQERQREPETQQREQQTGGKTAHKQLDFTITDRCDVTRGIRRALASYNRRTGDLVRYVILLLAIAGIVVSVLALRVHYDTGSEPCRLNDKWDCGVVNHSPYAEIHGVPVAAVGIAGYLLIGALGFLRRRGWLLVTVLIGLTFALYLTHIEASVLGVWCLYCVISQGIIAVLALLALTWLGWTRRRTKSA